MRRLGGLQRQSTFTQHQNLCCFHTPMVLSISSFDFFFILQLCYISSINQVHTRNRSTFHRAFTP